MNDYELRYEILALTLGVKDNDKIFTVSEDLKKSYLILFSTYQKMIEQDTTAFFVDKEQKEKIIASLKNTLDFYEATNRESIKQLLEKLENNHPTSFFMLPLDYLINDSLDAIHTSGIIVYKRDEAYTLMMIDKNRFDPVNYITIAKDDLDSLSHYLFHSNKVHPFDKDLYGELNEFVFLSKEKKLSPLNIKMNKQFISNCLFSEIEATLKTALFNCKINLFEHHPSQTTISPKWGSIFSFHSTLEIRKRFLTALKTNNTEFNKTLDYLFETYYLNRKNYAKKIKWKRDEKFINRLSNKNDPLSKLKYFILKPFFQIEGQSKWIHYKIANAKKFRADLKTKIDFTSIQQKLEKSTRTDQIENLTFLHSRYSFTNER